MTEEKPKCDIDDIMQQMQALNYLEGMKNLLGSEKFQKRYPELVGMDNVMKERMAEQRTALKETMEKCGMDTAEFVEEEKLAEELKEE